MREYVPTVIERKKWFLSTRNAEVVDRVLPPKRIIFDQIKKKKEITGRGMTDVENANKWLW